MPPAAKAPRPSPSESATLFATGTRKRGNNGKMYVVAETAAGVRRWVLAGAGAGADAGAGKQKTGAAAARRDLAMWRDRWQVAMGRR
jgi:hypothetical protein